MLFDFDALLKFDVAQPPSAVFFELNFTSTDFDYVNGTSSSFALPGEGDDGDTLYQRFALLTSGNLCAPCQAKTGSVG